MTVGSGSLNNNMNISYFKLKLKIKKLQKNFFNKASWLE